MRQEPAILRNLMPALAALVLITACAGRSAQRPDPTAEWLWEIPSPPVPAMAWVPAGTFRTGDRTPETVTAIVIHTTEGRFDDEFSIAENQNRNFAGVINYFKKNDRRVSAHYVMGPNGEICHMVNEKDVAHTQTYYNGRGFGIECAGWSRHPEVWTPELLESLVDLCAYLCVKWEIPAYHPEGTAYEGPWSVTVDEENKRFTGPGLVGHYQVQPWNKSDPGKHFPWEEFGESVRARILEYGAEPIPLPEPGSTNEVFVTARIREETVIAGEPFTWILTILGKDAGTLTATDVMFPDVDAIANVETVSGPVRTVTEPDRAVFELTLRTTDEKAANLHAGRANLKGTWHDSPTVRVKTQAPANQAMTDN